MRPLRHALLALALAGCGDGGGAGPTSPDAAPPPAPDAAAAGIALEDWVHDLVEHRTSDTAEPDTVDDKVIIDREDPAVFDDLLD